LTLEQFLG